MRRRLATLAVALVVVAPALFARAAEPIVVGEPIMVAPKAPNARGQIRPDVAYDGKGTYLVVWQQGRKTFEGPDPRIFAARLDKDGGVLDDTPIALCAASGAQERPRVRYARGVFLVVWQDFRNGADWDVYAMRVESSGKVLDGKGILVAGGIHSQAMPDVAAGSGGFLVAWQDYRDGERYRPYAAHVGADGKVAKPNGQLLKTRDGMALDGGSVTVVRAGPLWMLAVLREQTRYAARLDDSLIVVESAPLPSLMSQRAGRFYGDGKRALYVTTFPAGHGGPINPAVAALYDPSSATALANPNTEKANAGGGSSGWDHSRMIILRDGVAGAQGPVGVAFDGQKYLAAVRGRSERSNQIGVMRLAADGSRIDSEDAWTVAQDGDVPAAQPVVAASAPGAFLLVYELRGDPAGWRVMARKVSAP